jgi:pimeloyl-ACP methyl ester carboxylesterase
LRLVRVDFKPWGMARFIDLPSSELRDRWVSVDGVWGRRWSVCATRSWADDIHDFCDALHISRPVVLGHSMGAPVVLKYAARYLDVIEAGFLPVSAPPGSATVG